MAKLSPNQGGCWFCKTDDMEGPHTTKEKPDGGMNFTTEWDAYFHMSCLIYELNNKSPVNPEAEIIAIEFDVAC